MSSILKEIEWCPGCGNFGILKAFRNAVKRLGKDGIEKGRIVVVAGIGCHGKLPDYIDQPSFHTIHGRVLPMLTGIKLANPDLLPVGFSGDGDALNEGMEHFIHAAKRNTDVALFLHNNEVFGLTTGQFTATTPKGRRTRTTPFGNPEDPVNPCLLALISGATFVARGYAGNIKQLEELMYRAILHRGFSFLEILQPCVSFNNTWDLLRENVHEVSPAESFDDALRLVMDRFATGVLFKTEKETFEEILHKNRV
ncbi:thiamine pyrophosphate-dependent enzyme [Geoglobus ahangari]